jgi:divalent metal cation (Fe/Co/Zn/Cd) transporter
MKSDQKKAELYRWASLLALITIFYNVAEGMISVFFGIGDETIALLGFGVDSFVEVVSGVGIWHMTRRLKQSGDSTPDIFEKRALRITGTAFYILAFSLAAGVMVNIMQDHKPETTFWGIVIAMISILLMLVLIHYKLKVGKQLDSQAIIADARCTKTCLYLSIVLLLSSAGYELTGIGWLDSAGAILIAVISAREGREAFEKTRGEACSCATCCS